MDKISFKKFDAKTHKPKPPDKNHYSEEVLARSGEDWYLLCWDKGYWYIWDIGNNDYTMFPAKVDFWIDLETMELVN